jgi:ribonuclease HI
MLLSFARDLGLQDIILEGDAELVVRDINDKNPKWCRYGQILGDIKGILVGFRRYEVVHVKRGANEAAHVLAKLAS